MLVTVAFFIALLGTVAAGPLIDAQKVPEDGIERRDSTWNDEVESLGSKNRTRTKLTARNGWTFSIGCVGAGSIQPDNPPLTDILVATSTWFQESSTGPNCNANNWFGLQCSAPSERYFQGSFAVWNTGIMDCEAYAWLEQAVLSSCTIPGWGDCGCGVYYNYEVNGQYGECLVATFTYHSSGADVVAPNGRAAVRNADANHVTVNRPSRRGDVLGPTYNDLWECAYAADGTPATWCEGASSVC